MTWSICGLHVLKEKMSFYIKCSTCKTFMTVDYFGWLRNWQTFLAIHLDTFQIFSLYHSRHVIIGSHFFEVFQVLPFISFWTIVSNLWNTFGKMNLSLLAEILSKEWYYTSYFNFLNEWFCLNTFIDERNFYFLLVTKK